MTSLQSGHSGFSGLSTRSLTSSCPSRWSKLQDLEENGVELSTNSWQQAPIDEEFNEVVGGTNNETE